MKKTIMVLMLLFCGQTMFAQSNKNDTPKEVPAVSGEISSNVGAIELKSGVWDLVIPTKNGKAAHVVIIANDTVFHAFKAKNPGYVARIKDAVPINKVHIAMLSEKYQKKFLILLQSEGYFIATNWEVVKSGGGSTKNPLLDPNQ